MKPEDKPIWYDIYRAFPPKLEPRFDRPVPTVTIQPIFYEEDKVRARFHKEIKQIQSISLSSNRQTDCQLFIETFNKLNKQGALSEDKIFETSLELFQQQRAERLEAVSEAYTADRSVQSLSERFSMATAQDNPDQQKKETGTSIDVKDIFKE